MGSCVSTGGPILNKWLLTIALLLVVLLAPDQSISQSRQREREKSPLELTVSRSPTLKANSIQVDVFTHIPLDQLVFLADNSGFKSTYELSIFAVDKDDMVRATRIWREEVVKSRFEETQSEDLHHIAHTYFLLSPGEYRIVANLMDQDSRQRHQASEKIDVTGYPLGQLAIGDILLLTEAERVPGKPDRITPFVGNRVSDQADSIYIYFAIRTPMDEPSQASLHYTLGNKDDTAAVAFHKTFDLIYTLH